MYNNARILTKLLFLFVEKEIRNNIDNDYFLAMRWQQVYDREGTNNEEPGVYKILLLGGTGTGKSTIINMVTNYFLGGTLDQPKVVIPTKYYKVTEIKQDDKNIKEIIDTAISAGSLSAIVVIANGTEARVTPSIRNTLVRLANNLPDNLMGDNEARSEITQHWNKSITTINKLLETVTELAVVSTKAFELMRDLRNRIKSEIAKVTQDIANIQQVQDRLEAAQKALQKAGDQKKAFSNYTTSETITLKKIVESNKHSTVCTLHLKDDVICHENCSLSKETRQGTNHFVSCYCMGGGNKCRQCGCGAG
ncbi:10121_t:CDS:2, partial [Racocetra fulgida]